MEQATLFGPAPPDLRCRPPFSWIGGKQEMADWIISRFPRHETYVELFGGAAGVLLWKEPSPVEVYNDLDDDLVNFYRACRERPGELASLILFSPYSRAEWERCRAGVGEGDNLERARRFAVVARQSMGGAWGRAWSAVVAHSRRGMASGNSRWLNLPRDVLAVAARLAVVQIECLPAVQVAARYDRPGTLFYADPPYPQDVRSPGIYRREMTLDGHVALLECLSSRVGAVVLSGYDHPLYNERLASWGRHEADVKCRSNVTHTGTTATRPIRREVLWVKPAAPP
jgi:DNA adenine methylase